MRDTEIKFNSDDFYEATELIIERLDDFSNLAIYKISNAVSDYTWPFVPLDEGYLQGSYFEEVEGYDPMVLRVGYTAKSNDGYDYAEIQHEFPFRHPKKGTWKYMVMGTSKLQSEGLIPRIIIDSFDKTMPSREK